MPLYRKQKPKVFKTENEVVGNANSPLAYKQPVPERNIAFENAKATPENNAFVLAALNSIKQQTTILGTNLPVINNESVTEKYIKPIFLGTPGNPTDEFLYANPNASLNYETNEECEKMFLFANLQAKKSNRGFGKIIDKKDNNIPNVITKKVPSDTNEKFQLMFLEQTDNDSKIKVNAYDLVVENTGKGIGTVIQSPIQLDTWYNKKSNINDIPNGRNSRWIDYNIGDNVTVGATNDTINKRNIGERYDWSFGSIFLVKTFGTTTNINDQEDIYKQVKYEFDTTTGTITLKDWDYVIYDSPTTYEDRYTTKATLIANQTPQVDTEILTKEETANGVVGRKIFTYFIKAFEEGECIRIEEVYGGIRINVDFNYNGRCCEKFIIASSSSEETCFPLVPGNINEYQLQDGKVCLEFEGEDDQIGYVEICGEDIPVSTVNGFLVWNYGTVNAYTFEVFNECQGFYTSNGCYYEVCFTGYPKIKFTVELISKSSSSTSSASYSSSSSSSSSSSLGNSSSSSSYLINESSSSSFSSDQSSKSDQSSSSSFSSLSRSSQSSKVSSSSNSSSSTSSVSDNSSSSRSTSSSSSSSNAISTSSQSDSSASETSVSDSSISGLDDSSISLQSKSSRSSPSSNSSSSGNSTSSSSSMSSASSQSSNIDLDFEINYPTDSYNMHSLAKLFDVETLKFNIGVVAGDAYGQINGNDYQNAFIFSEEGNILNYVTSMEESTSYALDVESKYFTSFEKNLLVYGGNFNINGVDVSGNPTILTTPLLMTDEFNAVYYDIVVDNIVNPFLSTVYTSDFVSCVKFINNYLFVCGQLSYNGRNGFHGLKLEQSNFYTNTMSFSTSGAYAFNLGVSGGAIRDLRGNSDFFTTGKVWAVGDFTSPRDYLMIVKNAGLETSFNYELSGPAYSIEEINTVNQDLSSISDSSVSNVSRSSQSSLSISFSSDSSERSSPSSFSNSYSSLSDFSSKSSLSSPSSNSVSSDSSTSSSTSVSSQSFSYSSNSSSSDSNDSFGYTQKVYVVAGNFVNVNKIAPATSYARNNLAFFDSNGNLLDYKIINSINGAIRKVLYDPDYNMLYLAGDFTSVQDKFGNIYSPKYLMAFNIDPANDIFTYTPINVNPDNSVYDMMMLGSRIYLAGYFSGINSLYRPGIGAFNRKTYKVY
jgi:hypothetical protein